MLKQEEKGKTFTADTLQYKKLIPREIELELETFTSTSRSIDKKT